MARDEDDRHRKVQQAQEHGEVRLDERLRDEHLREGRTCGEPVCALVELNVGEYHGGKAQEYGFCNDEEGDLVLDAGTEFPLALHAADFARQEPAVSVEERAELHGCIIEKDVADDDNDSDVVG